MTSTGFAMLAAATEGSLSPPKAAVSLDLLESLMWFRLTHERRRAELGWGKPVPEHEALRVAFSDWRQPGRLARWVLALSIAWHAAKV